MKFPNELWSDPKDRELVSAIADAFTDEALLLTDQLINIVWVSPKAEELFQERGEAIVNRLTFSLLGMDDSPPQLDCLKRALSGESAPWRGRAKLDSQRETFLEASALIGPSGFLCGIIRLKGPSNPCHGKG